MGLFSQPLPEGRGSHADSQLESRLPQETEDEPYLRRSEQDGFLGISRAGEFVFLAIQLRRVRRAEAGCMWGR